MQLWIFTPLLTVEGHWMLLEKIKEVVIRWISDKAWSKSFSRCNWKANLLFLLQRGGLHLLMLSNEIIPSTTRLFFNWRKWVFIFKDDLGVRWMIKISLSTFLNIFKRQNRHQGHKIMIVLTKLTYFEIEASGFKYYTS